MTRMRGRSSLTRHTGHDIADLHDLAADKAGERESPALRRALLDRSLREPIGTIYSNVQAASNSGGTHGGHVGRD